MTEVKAELVGSVWKITAKPGDQVVTNGYGIAVDAANKRFYVAEPGVNQVVVYSTVSPYKLLGVIK